MIEWYTNMTKDYFSYNDIQIPDCSFRISPSQISKFFEYPAVWFRENFLGEKGFTASTSTVLGTIIHAAAESYVDGTPITREQIESYLSQVQRSQPLDQPAIMVEEIRSLYPDMSMALVNEYVRKNKPTATEEAVHTKVLDDIYVGGTCDNRTRDIVVDYKNVSTKPNTDSIPFHYLIQLLAYAYCYRAMGTPITKVRLVYTVRPTKTLPVRVFVVNHIITDDDWDLISSTLQLMALTIQKHREDPTLIPLLYKSLKLKDTL